MNKPEILIVEDDKAIKNLISTTLELEGYRYHTAENGAQAILSAATQQPDIMLLDLGLPDMDGVQVIAKVRTWSQMLGSIRRERQCHSELLVAICS